MITPFDLVEISSTTCVAFWYSLFSLFFFSFSDLSLIDAITGLSSADSSGSTFLISSVSWSFRLLLLFVLGFLDFEALGVLGFSATTCTSLFFLVSLLMIREISDSFPLSQSSPLVISFPSPLLSIFLLKLEEWTYFKSGRGFWDSVSMEELNSSRSIGLERLFPTFLKVVGVSILIEGITGSADILLMLRSGWADMMLLWVEALAEDDSQRYFSRESKFLLILSNLFLYQISSYTRNHKAFSKWKILRNWAGKLLIFTKACSDYLHLELILGGLKDIWVFWDWCNFSGV